MRIVLLFIIIVISFSNGFSQKRFKSQKLVNDFDFAVQELRLQHQGFYNYEAQDLVDAKIYNLREELNKSMTRLEFYQLIRRLVAVMNEGHGSVSLPKWTMVKTGLSKSFLPLTVKFVNRELIITQNFGDDIKELSNGIKILSINGRSVNEIIEDLFPLISTDGSNETSKYEWMDNVILSLLHRLVYGKSSIYELEVMVKGDTESRLINIPAIRFSKFKSKNAKLKSKRFNYTSFNYKQLNDSIAYLSIPSFNKDRQDFPKFYEETFMNIYESNIKHLILDIQNNGGGTEGNDNLLYHYLSDEEIRKYRKVTMLPNPYLKDKNDKDIILDKWVLEDTVAERGEFTCYSNYFSTLGYSMPNENYVYKNNLYVLISGSTFSGGAEFASMIKMTKRGVFVGEETGGAYEGNVSSYNQTVKLPNTKIKIDIPIVHYQIDVEPKIKGRGVMPDFEVPQTFEDYLNNINSKLEFTKKLIMD